MKTTSGKSCAPNLFVGSHLNFDPPVKVKLVLATFSPFSFATLKLKTLSQVTQSPFTALIAYFTS